MRRLTWLICWLVLFVGAWHHDARAWFWNDDVLVTINGDTFTDQDYRHWWQNWQEEGMEVPDSPDSFIDWQLMVQEGTRMQLDSEPSYRRKVETFLKVRSLMMLKNEEIDSRIEVSRDEIWALYEKEYCPRWRLAVFFFADKQLAADKVAALRQGDTTPEELKELSHKDGGPLFYEAKWLRYPQIKEDWLAALEGHEPGYITDPQAMGKYFILLHFMEKRGPEEEDFAKVKKNIANKIRDIKSSELTVALVERLKQKYQVQVDEEFLATIGDTPLELEESEKPVITTSEGEISAGAVQAMMAKERRFRKQYNFPAEDEADLKKRVVANMLSQTLISWEAMNRHYEKTEPFAGVYQFYRKHRLVKEIEKRFIQPEAEVDDTEVKAYYEENLGKYSHPEMVSFVLAEGEEELIKRMRHEVTQGADFLEVAAKHFPGGLPVRQVPVSHLDSELKEPLLALSKGEVSLPFAMKDNYAMAKLVNRRSAMPVPFQQVKDEISAKLKGEKFTVSRNEFLGLLKEKSTIKVHNKVWRKLRKELAQ